MSENTSASEIDRTLNDAYGLVFRVYGEFTEDGRVSVREVRQQEGLVITFPPTEADLIILDSAENELARAPIRRHFDHAVSPRRPDAHPLAPLECSYWLSKHFTAEVAACENGVTLAVMRGNETLWTRHAPGPRPQFQNAACEIGKEVITVQWSDNIENDALCEVRVEYARNEKHWWRPLSHRCTIEEMRARKESWRGRKLLCDIEEIPQGDGLLRVSASNGFHTIFSVPIPVTLAERPPRIEIGNPTVSNYARSWGKLSFEARAETHRRDGGGIYDGNLYRWLMDGVPVGAGMNLYLDTLPLGSHSVTVVLTYNGQETSKTLEFDLTEDLLASAQLAQQLRSDMREWFPHWDWPEK